MVKVDKKSNIAVKKNRQRKIVELIENMDIETQEDLSDLLSERGFEVTQATISRDIRELKILKVTDDSGKQKYAIVSQSENHLGAKYLRVLKEGFLSVTQAQNILVIKTVPGMAMAVAAAIDAMKFKEIAGSIAGDDTIMVAVLTTKEAGELIPKISEIIES
ncbi:MAG: arginine repressor [Lachnospiraceae bacterium]|nr:arginine repressor [Lachnospiraceae bacterium]MBR5944240.1 arginine repressor [Lachnospiraceae bacterium]